MNLILLGRFWVGKDLFTEPNIFVFCPLAMEALLLEVVGGRGSGQSPSVAASDLFGVSDPMGFHSSASWSYFSVPSGLAGLGSLGGSGEKRDAAYGESREGVVTHVKWMGI